MEKNIIHTLDYGERVTSTYAEIYHDDSYCDYKEIIHKKGPPNTSKHHDENKSNGEWTSPSDLLIGILDLKPPFTSKITRGITHEGILAIGNQVLEAERVKFLKHVTELLHENDAAWNHILEHEKASVAKKVKEIYQHIFRNKSKIMTEEITKFYEATLLELEEHLKSEVENVLITSHANIISDLNVEIKQKLIKEKAILNEILRKRYKSEIQKIKLYYKLLLQNELYRNNKLVNYAMSDRNDAMKAFCKQIDADNITNTMYIMCTERKKCRIKQFILENYQDTEIKEKLQTLKNKQDLLDAFKDNHIHLSDINKEWEEKIRKVLKLFLKFISFGLKLLPEQTTFLLDFEKMVVLQLNEIQKLPDKSSSILVHEEKIHNIFKFEEPMHAEYVCGTEPFVVIGDLSDPIPPRYGSRETLPSDVDLPTIRLQRQFVYAKCHKFEDIKRILELERCKCSDTHTKPVSREDLHSESTNSIQPSTSHVSESSNETFLIDDFRRLDYCPIRRCKVWAKRLSFPYLDSYLDFTEENFGRVKAILGEPHEKYCIPELIDPKDIVNKEIHFAATNERYHTVETQYSSREDLNMPDIECPCIEDVHRSKQNVPPSHVKESTSKTLDEILTKRRNSLRQLILEKPNLLKIFTDECFDFQM